MSDQQQGTLVPVDEPGDAELISAVRAGDVDAYGMLYARHVDAARRLARQLVAAGDVDDLVSEAFAKVLSVLQRGGGPDLAFRAYLLTSVRRLHVDKLRGGARLQTTDDLTPYDPGVPFEDTAVAGFENTTAAKAFASLPERWQQVLWHTEVEGQKPAEVAPLLGMTPNSVSALAYRAREGLRQAFVTLHATDVVDDECSPTRAHLGAYLRGGLSRRDSAKVEAHLQECRPCTAIYLELSEVNADLGAVLAPLLLGSVGAGYLAASHAAAAVAAKGGLLLLLDRGKDWVLHNPTGRAVGGVAAATVVAAVIATGVSLSGTPRNQNASLDAPTASTSPAAPGATSGGAGGASGGETGPATAPARRSGDRPSSAGNGVAVPPASIVPFTPPATPSSPSSPPSTSPSSPTSPTPTSTPPSPDASGPTNGAPIIETPLAAVSLAPEARSVAIDLTRGARDPDGDALSVESASITSQPRHGTVTRGGTVPRSLAWAPFTAPTSTDRTGPGIVTYTPDLSWRGSEVIGYVLTDGDHTVAGTVEVRTPNRRPVLSADATTRHVGEPSPPIPVLDNDTDPNHDALTVTSVGDVTSPLGGEAAVTPDGRHVTYRPAVSTLPGTASFTYTASDGHGETATATVTVTYGNVAPTADDDQATTPATGDRSVVVDVLANDSDPDGDPLTATLRTKPEDGTVVSDGDGFRYTPDPTFDGEDSFGYTVTDGYGGSSTATVTITVVEPHSAFVLGDAHAAQDTPYLYSRPTVSGIPEGRHATVTVTITGFERWSSNTIALDDACGTWPSTGSTRALVCHLDSSHNGRQLGHFDAYASSIVLSATADDFDAADAKAVLAPRSEAPAPE